MAEIDFITAFARLLRDGTLRDQFAEDALAAAKNIQLRLTDYPAWQQLVSADVEFQADVLLRKRLDAVKTFAPATCRRLGDTLWPVFREFARHHWPGEEDEKFLDAHQFCRALKQKQPDAVAGWEWNRFKFALSKSHVAFFLVKIPLAKNKSRRGIQLLTRNRSGRGREFFIYLGL